jgi:NAD(P)H-dependent FMN reductase
MNPILIIAGTNRPASNASKLAAIIKGFYDRQGVAAEVYSLAEMPASLFTPGAYASKPPEWVAVQERVVKSAGLHVVVPEYNGSYPGVLKYFIDMLKFPESFERKPVAFVGEAAGQWGALRAVEQLEGVFGYRNAHRYPRRIFIPAVHTKFDASGAFADEAILKMLDEQCAGFAAFCRAVG